MYKTATWKTVTSLINNRMYLFECTNKKKLKTYVSQCYETFCFHWVLSKIICLFANMVRFLLPDVRIGYVSCIIFLIFASLFCVRCFVLGSGKLKRLVSLDEIVIQKNCKVGRITFQGSRC